MGLVQIPSIHVHLHTPFVIVYHFVHISSISIHVHAQHNSVEYPYTIAELIIRFLLKKAHSTSGGVNHDDTALL